MSDNVPLNNQGNGNEDGNPSYSGSSPTTPSIDLDNVVDDEIEYPTPETFRVTDATDKIAELLDCNKSTAYTKDIEDILKEAADSFEESRRSNRDLKIDAGQNPYVVDKNIYAKRAECLKFRILNAEEGYTLKLSMKNAEDAKKDNPLKPCENHFAEPVDHQDYKQEDIIFYVNRDLKPRYQESDFHPALLIDFKEDMIRKGIIEVSIFIKCLNSCDSAKFGKVWNMTLSILLTETPRPSNIVIMEETFIVKVCMAPKCDMDKANEKKRKAEIQEGPADHSKKTKMIMMMSSESGVQKRVIAEMEKNLALARQQLDEVKKGKTDLEEKLKQIKQMKEHDKEKRRNLEDALRTVEAQKLSLEQELACARKEVDSMLVVLETQLQCPICKELFITAMMLECSHTFCKYCIERCKKNKQECPICRAHITSETRSLVVDNFIDEIVHTLSEEMRQRRSEMVAERTSEIAAMAAAEPAAQFIEANYIN